MMVVELQEPIAASDDAPVAVSPNGAADFHPRRRHRCSHFALDSLTFCLDQSVNPVLPLPV